MKIKELDSKKLYKEYQIDIPYEDLDKAIDERIQEIIPTIALPGFRKGKAPINIVKKKYEDSVLNEIVEKIVQNKTASLIKEKKLDVYRQPKIEIKKFKKNETLEIGIKIDLKPEIKIFPFEKIEHSKYNISLDEKNIKDNYNTFISSQQTYKKISISRVAKNSDKVMVNINTDDNLAPDFLKSQKNIPVIIDSDYQVLPDIGKELINKKSKIGDKFKIKFDLKKVLKITKKTLVEFEIEILDIEEKIPFKVDNDFLSKNNFKNENELKNSLIKNLEIQYNNYLYEIEKKDLMDKLEIQNNFDIPEGLLEDEFHAIWHKVEHAKKDNTLDDDDKKLSDKKLKERYKKISLRRVKLAILLQEIATKENISVNEKELTDGMLKYASQYPGQEKEIFEYFKKNPSSVESVRGPIFEKKIIDFIISKVKIKPKKITVNEFKKLQEDSFNYSKENK